MWEFVSTAVRKVRNLLAASWFEWLWLPITFLLLGVCRVAILVLPFKLYSWMLGVPGGVEPWLPILTPSQRMKAARVRKLISRSAHNAWWVANCLPQALAACALLRLFRVPYAAFLGVETSKGAVVSMQAHAWVGAGSVQVCGGDGFDGNVVVQVYRGC